MKLPSFQRGALIITAIVLLVIVAVLVAVASYLSIANVGSGTGHMSSAQALFVAESGIQRAVYQYKTGTACGALTNTNVAVSTGNFTTSGTLYNPASTTISKAGGITAADTVIPVASIAGYAPHGRASIESEEINYSGTSTSSAVCGAGLTACLTGATRGVAGTTAAAHAFGVSVSQNQCLIRSTGNALGGGKRVLDTVMLPQANLASLDGAATLISPGGANVTIGTLATALPAGNNVIIVMVSLRNATGAGRTVIAAGNLKLLRGATTLASNELSIEVGDSATPTGPNNAFPQEVQFLLYKDAGAPANATYTVTANGNNANTTAEVKMAVISGAPPNSSFADGGSVNIGAVTTVLSLNTAPFPAGDNVIIAAVSFDNTSANNRSVAAGNLRIAKGATVLTSNTYKIEFSKAANANHSAGVLLLVRDPGSTADPTYSVTLGAPLAGVVNAEAKMIVLNGVQSAFLNGASTAIGAAPTTLASLATTFTQGDNLVLAGNQYFNNATAQRNIPATNETIAFAGTVQASNQFDINLGSGNQQDDFNTGLLWRHSGAGASPTYDVRVAATGGANISGQSKLLAVHFDPAVVADWREIYP